MGPALGGAMAPFGFASVCWSAAALTLVALVGGCIKLPKVTPASRKKF